MVDGKQAAMLSGEPQGQNAGVPSEEADGTECLIIVGRLLECEACTDLLARISVFWTRVSEEE